MFSATLGLLAREGGDGPRFLFPLVLLLLLGGLAAWLIRRRRNGGGPDRASALGTLQDRFARGDIDRAEFEHRQAVLVGAETVPPAPQRPAPPAPPAPTTQAPPTPDTEPDPQPDTPDDTGVEE